MPRDKCAGANNVKLLYLILDNLSFCPFLTPMDQGEFDAASIRKALKPRLSRNEMARKIGISYSFLRTLEEGFCKWPAPRKEKFEQIVKEWQENPVHTPRKKRSDAGIKKKGKSQPVRRGRVVPMPVPVPHEHGQLVGIG